MLTIKADIENIKKCALLYTLYKKIGYSEYSYPSEKTGMGEKFNTCIELINELDKAKDVYEYLYDNKDAGDYGGNINYLICGWALWDQRVCFNFKGNDGKSFLYDLNLSCTGYDSTTPGTDPLFRLKQKSLEEMYDLVREANFIERDYTNEKDMSFYFEELKPSANSDTIIDIEENRFRESSRYNHADTDPNKTPFKELIDYLYGDYSGNTSFASKMIYVTGSLMRPINVEVGNIHYTISDLVTRTK